MANRPRARATGLLLPLLPVLPLLLGIGGCFEPERSASPAAPPIPLMSQIEYRFVGDGGETDAQGWTLLWIADLEGDLSGEVYWYFREPNPIPDLPVRGGSIAYYEARWEVRQSDEVVLSGRSSGKTVTREGEDGIWDGHGVVTAAAAPFQEYLGRHTYETGSVHLDEESPWGRGLFSLR